MTPCNVDSPIKRIKGSSMIFAIFTILIVSIICLTIIQYIGTFQSLYQNSIKIARTHQDLLSALNYTLGHEYGKESVFELPPFINLNGDTVHLEKTNWGLLTILNLRKQSIDEKLELLCILGYKPISKEGMCLYLSGQKSNLKVCGKTRLIGDLFVPGKEINIGYIGNRRFESDKIYSGEIHGSSNILPPLPSEVRTLTYRKMVKEVFRRPSILDFDDFKNLTGYVKSRSFSDSTLKYSSANPILLSNCSLNGNIIICSNISIEIDSTATVEDIILFAPRIKVRSGFQGQIQMFASDSIIIDSNSILNYPSVVALISEEKSFPPHIVIDKKVIIDGLVLSNYPKPNKLQNIQYLRIGENSEINGQVYFDGYVEHNGTVNGQLYCHLFLLNTQSSFYINCLLDASIDYYSLPTHFAFPLKMGNISKPTVLKWLH